MLEEYVSNPRLALLAKELAILNKKLIAEKLSDNARLFRLRDFAQSSRYITGYSFTETEAVEDEVIGYKWRISLGSKNLGRFDSANLARDAYRKAHIEKFGIKSEFHPDYPIDDLHLYDRLPVGIQLTPSDRFRAMICLPTEYKTLGTFDTLPEAVAVYKAAYLAHHGKPSRSHPDENESV